MIPALLSNSRRCCITCLLGMVAAWVLSKCCIRSAWAQELGSLVAAPRVGTLSFTSPQPPTFAATAPSFDSVAVAWNQQGTLTENPFPTLVGPESYAGRLESVEGLTQDQPSVNDRIPISGQQWYEPGFYQPSDPAQVMAVPEGRFARIGWTLSNDYTNFYSRETMINLGMVALVGASIANTNFDEECREAMLDIAKTGNGGIGDFLHGTKEFGNGFRTLPIFAVAAATSLVAEDIPMLEPVGDWGNHSLRMFLIGGPVVALGQMATGGSRPGEMPHGSSWRPFADNNGVSGHAFMGAIPFLAAAELTDRKDLKAVLIASSTLTGLSRISDDDHYTSQVIMGWTVAYLSHRAASRTNQSAEGWHLTGWQGNDAQGLGFERRW